MTDEARYDPGSGELDLDAGLADALLDDHRRAGAVEHPALSDAVADPRLTLMLTALDLPVCRLRVMRDGGEIALTLGRDTLVVALSTEPGRLRLQPLPAAQLVGLLAELVDLGPRELDRTRPVRVAASVLAEAIARPGAGDPPPPLDDIRSHWRIESRPAANGAGGRSLEALDAAGSWWLLTASGGEVELAPVRAERIYRGFGRLVPPPAD